MALFDSVRGILRRALEEGERFNASNAEQLARVMLADSRSVADMERRDEARRIVRAYYADNIDDFLVYLKRFAFEKPENKANVKSALTRKYAFEKSKVFNAAPVLQVHVGDELDEEQTALFTAIYESGRWFEALQQAGRLEKIVNTVHLLQRVNFDRGTISLDTLTPDETIVFQRVGTPNEPFAIMYRITDLELFDTPHEESVVPQLWAFWSEESTFQFVFDGSTGKIDQVIAPENNAEMINPFAELPVVKVQNERPGNGQYWGPVANDIWLAEMSTSAGFVAVLEAIIDQGFSLTFSSGFDDGAFTDGRGTGTHVNQPVVRQGEQAPTFGAVKLDANIGQMVDGADAIAQHIAVMRGLNPQAFSIKQQAESGFSKLVDLAPQMEEREGDIARWTVYLKEAFDLLKVIWPAAKGMQGFDTELTGDFSDDAELFVSFVEPKALETPTERLDRIERQQRMGLMSDIEAIMEIDPDLNESQAEKRLADIAERATANQPESLLGALTQPRFGRRDDRRFRRDREDRDDDTRAT